MSHPPDVETSRSLVREALDSNRSLQATIRFELEKIRECQARNRRQSALVWRKRALEEQQRKQIATEQDAREIYKRMRRSYFVSPHVAQPMASNADTRTRERLRAAFPIPWSKPESMELTTATNELGTDDWDRVADRVTSRSALECRLQHQQSTKTRPFSNDEKDSIQRLVQEHDKPDWEDVVNELDDRTAWECYVCYRTQLQPISTDVPWSPTEDALLLQFYAACGPQHVVDSASLADAATRFFPDKSVVQLNRRVNQSLLNPNLVQDSWTPDDERKLCILMKLYSRDPNPLSRVACHFTDRATKSVNLKWRSQYNQDFRKDP